MVNKGKKNLVIWAIVLCFLSAVSTLVYVFLLAFAFDKIAYLYGIEIVTADIEFAKMNEILECSVVSVLNVAAAICLIYYLKKVDKNPRLGKKLFFTGLFLNVFASPFAIPSILLYIAHFKYPDFERTQKDADQEVITTASEIELKQKIEYLRKIKAEGKITQEEFDQELTKLL